METIEQKLDRLAEFHSQKDSIEAQKRAMLDEVKVPAEVEAIVKAGMNQVGAVERGYYAKFDEINRQVAEQLEKIVVPDEIKIALAAIDRERAIVNAWKQAKEAEYREEIAKKKAELQAEYESQTRAVYAALETRKQEISAEFVDKNAAVDTNIAALEKEIKDDVKREGKTVNGRYFQAVYVRGRVSWNTDGLDAYANDHPEVSYFRKVGEPSISIKSRK